MKRYFIHHPVFRILAPAFYGALVYLLVLMINDTVAQINDLFNSQELYLCIGLTYLAFEACRLVIVIQHRFQQNKSTSRLIATQVLATLILSTALVMGCLHLYFQHVIGFGMTNEQFAVFLAVFGVTAALYNLLYISDYYLHQENTLKLQAEMQNKAVLEVEMQEFQHDINPELLYESLESLIGIMYRDVEKAEAYIDSLATAYRYVLTNRHHELIAAETEIDAARNLVRLLNERYFGQLAFDVTDDDKSLADTLLIPGSLPILVEYIVRNTIVTRFEPLAITCYTEDNYLVLQSKLNDRLIPYADSEVAFTRLQRSYSLYSDLPLIKVKAYQENYIKLPLLRVEEATPLEAL
jgi:LytS/YehU family sensor histidine kinase